MSVCRSVSFCHFSIAVVEKGSFTICPFEFLDGIGFCFIYSVGNRTGRFSRVICFAILPAFAGHDSATD